MILFSFDRTVPCNESIFLLWYWWSLMKDTKDNDSPMMVKRTVYSKGGHSMRNIVNLMIIIIMMLISCWWWLITVIMTIIRRWWRLAAPSQIVGVAKDEETGRSGPRFNLRWFLIKDHRNNFPFLPSSSSYKKVNQWWVWIQRRQVGRNFFWAKNVINSHK